MKKNGWKIFLEVVIAALTALATSLGVAQM